jgi:PEGA domain
MFLASSAFTPNITRLRVVFLLVFALLCFPTAYAQENSASVNNGESELKILTSNETEKDSGVWIDGEYIGYLRDFWGNRKILLMPGEHEVTVRKFGYKDFTQKVMAEPGKDFLIVTMMQIDTATQYPVQNTADFRVNVSPSEAAVLVDGAFVGYAGQFMGLSKVLTVTAGQRRIRIEMKGYRPYETALNVVAGRSGELKAALSKGGPELDGSPRIIQSSISDGATSLQLAPGRTYLYGMAVGGKGSSTMFSLGQYASVFHEEGHLGAAVAYGNNSVNTYNTQTERHILGGVSVGGAWQMLRTFYGSNGAQGAGEATALFTADQNSLVVVIGLASSQQQISLDGIPGLQIDTTHSGASVGASMIIGHAILPAGMYKVVEHSGSLSQGTSPDTAADLVSVFVFGAASLAPQ